MGFSFIHSLQILPLFLWVLALSSRSYLLNPPEYFTEIVMGLSFIVLFSSSRRSKFFSKFFFFSSLSLLCLFCLNKLIDQPTMGTFILSLYFLTLHFATQKQKVSKPKILHLISSFSIPFFLFISLKNSNIEHFFLYLFGINLGCSSNLLLNSYFFKRIYNSRSYLILPPAAIGLFYYFDLKDQAALFTMVFLLLSAFTTCFSLYHQSSLEKSERFYRSVFSTPEISIIFYFIILSGLGTLLLQMPISQSISTRHGILDSLFTSVSAACVTGLTVLNTEVDFSLFGQIVILIIIQLGGLGIVSLSSWALLILGTRKISLSQELTIKSMSSYSATISTRDLVHRILFYFLFWELLGALTLTGLFFKNNGGQLLKAFWMGLFTSISAFCNAGFSVDSSSLVSQQNHPLTLYVISILIIAGGFSPLYAIDLPSKLIKKRMNLNEKLIFRATLTLLLFGFFSFLLIEWNASLASMNFWDKIANSWFQSTTTRTAGFNSLDLNTTHNFTHFLFMFLMFIGGNAGSTAGGIKVITAVILFYTIYSSLLGLRETQALKRRLAHRDVYRAFSIFSTGFIVIFLAFFVLSMTQQIDSITLLFETVSAVATVGLSLGATAELDEVGKVVIIVCMFVGRIGPLTFLLLLLKDRKKQNYTLPEENLFL